MENINHVALAAAADETKLNEFIESNEQFILTCAGKHSGRFITTSDDEFSIALHAFYEAVTKYEQSQGDFLPFAGMVIKRRLTDYYRSQQKFRDEHMTSPDVFSGNIDDEAEDNIQYEVQEKLADTPAPTAADEIAAVTEVFAKFGFSFMDLADSSPKAGKTKAQCAQAVQYILSSPMMLSSILQSHVLPVKSLADQSKVSKKVLERHRKYIIAAVIILTGDYPVLAEYMKFLKKGGTA